ncbi:MAG: gmd 2 [Rubritepida sp.]|nr:gmd 2 [Rubritepida sp.]
MPSPVALITGINGQDGSYLAELLLEKGYAVHGIRRRVSAPSTANIDHLRGEGSALTLHFGDMDDTAGLMRTLELTQPDEVYNLAAQSHVGLSFKAPEQTANIDGLGAVRMLESIRRIDSARRMRFFQATSSEMFAGNPSGPQNEDTPFHPRSPYGVAKLYAHWITVNHREAHGMHASSGIMFNHESPRRGEGFVTRKITRAVAAIHLGRQDRLALGDLDAARDWGHARDYAEGMWRMLQQAEADDYVLATGVTHTVRQFVEAAFQETGTQLAWEGTRVEERGRCTASGRILVQVDPAFFRPTQGGGVAGDAAKAGRVLGWRPGTAFGALVAEMVRSDLARLAAPAPAQGA